MALILPILMQESFWWWQCSVRYRLPLPPPPGISVPASTSRRQLWVKQVKSAKCTAMLEVPVLCTVAQILWVEVCQYTPVIKWSSVLNTFNQPNQPSEPRPECTGMLHASVLCNVAWILCTEVCQYTSNTVEPLMNDDSNASFSSLATYWVEHRLQVVFALLWDHFSSNPHLLFRTSSTLHSFPAAPLFCRHPSVLNTIHPH